MNTARRIAALVIVAALVAGMARWWRTELPEAGELRIVSVNRIESLDPGIDRLPASLTRRVSEALWDELVTFDAETMLVRPGVAQSWTASDGGRRLVFHLTPAARWSNGEPVTAADFVRQLHALLGRTPPSSSQLVRLLSASGASDPERPAAIAVHALDDQTLEIRCQHPPPDLVARIALARWIPLHASTPAQFAGGRQPGPGELVSNGPFRLESVGAEEILLTRNPWHAAPVAANAPARLRFGYTETAWLYPALLRSGRAHVSEAVNFLEDDRRRPPAGTVLAHESTSSVSTLQFNTTRRPLNDVRVRRALSLALDRAALARKFSGGALPAYAFTPPLRADSEGLRTIDENLEEARRLLALAGYPDGAGFPVLRIPVVMNEYGNPLAYYCADQWRERLGIRVYVAPIRADEMAARAERGDFDLMHYRWIGTPLDVSVFAAQLVAPLPRPFRVQADEALERAIEGAQALEGPARRAAIVAIERAAAPELPSTPVLLYHRYVLMSDRVSGWSRDIFGRHPLSALALSAAEATP